MALLTQRTWVWASSGSWWWTAKPGVLHSVGLQTVGHNWATELTDCDSAVKSSPAMQETWVQSLGRENSLEDFIATHSRTFTWKLHGQRSLAGYSPWGCKQEDINWSDWVCKDTCISKLLSTILWKSKNVEKGKENLGIWTGKEGCKTQ